MPLSRSGVFYGWWVVAVSALGLFFSAPAIAVYSYSVFLKAVAQDFHVGRGAVAVAFTLHNLCTAAVIPIVGYLIDRFGAKRIVVPATALAGLAAILAKFIGTSLWQYYALYIALGLLGPASGPVPYSAIISRWFDRRRGLALGLMSFGSGLAAIVYPPAAQHLIAQFGWRSAYSILGVGILCAPILFLTVFLKDEPGSKGLFADGIVPVDRSSAPDSGIAGLDWGEIWRSRTFWLLIAAFFLAGASVHACVLHLAALLSDRGFSPQAAANAVSIIGAAMLLGRTGSGYFLDRFFAPRVCAVLFGQSAVGIALLATGASGALALIAAFMVGLAFGAEVEVIAFLVSRYFGLRSFGLTYGFGFSSFVLAGAGGAYMMGAGFDRTHTYAAPLFLVLAAMIVATILFTRLGAYRFAPASFTTPRVTAVTALAEEDAL